jgi:hypothetical protein
MQNAKCKICVHLFFPFMVMILLADIFAISKYLVNSLYILVLNSVLMTPSAI